MNEFGVKGLMTAKEYAEYMNLTLEQIGISEDYAKVHFFFIGLAKNAKKEVAKAASAQFVKQIKELSKKTKKVIFIQEGAPECGGCILEYSNFHGSYFHKYSDRFDPVKLNSYGQILPRFKEKPYNFFLLDPVYSQFFSLETKQKIEEIGFTNLQDYQKYIQDNFLFIFCYNDVIQSVLLWQLEKRKGDRSEDERYYQDLPFYTPPLGQYYEVIDGHFYQVSNDFYEKSRKLPNYEEFSSFILTAFKLSGDAKTDAYKIFDSLIAAAENNTLDVSSFSYDQIKSELQKILVEKEKIEIKELVDTIYKNSFMDYLSSSFPDTASVTLYSDGSPVVNIKNDQNSLDMFAKFLESTGGTNRLTDKYISYFKDPETAKSKFYTESYDADLREFRVKLNGYNIPTVYLPNNTVPVSLMLDYDTVKNEISIRLSGSVDRYKIKGVSSDIKFDSIYRYAPFIKPYLRDILSNFVNTFLEHYLQLKPYVKESTTKPVAIIPAVAPPPPEPQPEPEPIVAAPPPPPPPSEPEIKPAVEEPKPVEPWPLKYLTKEDLSNFKEINSVLNGNETESPYQPWLNKDYISNIFTKTKVLPLTIEDGPDFKTKDNVLVSVSGGINSLTANIPILGQAYPTTQFLSSMEPNYQLNLIASNNMHANGLEDSASDLPNAIKRLEEINTTTLRTAREYKFVPDGSSILVDSFITRLFGSFKEEYVILDSTDNLGSYYVTLKKPISIESTEYRTLESNPGASAYSMRLSETNVYDPEVLKEVTTNKKLKNDQLYNEVVNYALMNCDSSSYMNRFVDTKENILVNNIETGDVFEWQTKYFKSWDFFGQYLNKKDELKKLLEEKQIARIVNLNLYDLASTYLDPLFEILAKHEKYAKFFKGIKITSGFSTDEDDTRTTFSQHYFGSAVDIVVPNFNALHIVRILQKISDTANRKIGIGVYGNDILKKNYYKGIETDVADLTWCTVMDGQKATTGFVHVDLRLNMLDQSEYDSKLETYANSNNTTVQNLKNFDKKKFSSLTQEEKDTYFALRKLKMESFKKDTNNSNYEPEYQSSVFWSADTEGSYAVGYNDGKIDVFKTNIAPVEASNTFTIYDVYLGKISSQHLPLYNYFDQNYYNNNEISINNSGDMSNTNQYYKFLFTSFRDLIIDVETNTPLDSDDVNNIDDVDADIDTDIVKTTNSLEFSKETSLYDESLRQERFFNQLDQLFNRDAIDYVFGIDYEQKKFSELEDPVKQKLMSSNVTNESPVYIYDIDNGGELISSEKYNDFYHKYRAANPQLSSTAAEVLTAYFKENKIDAYVEEGNELIFTDYKIYILDPLTTSTFTKRQTSNAAEEIKVKKLLTMICDFHLLAGILLIEPYVYLDDEKEIKKEIARFNSTFYGISVVPLYFNNLYYAITGLSLESYQNEGIQPYNQQELLGKKIQLTNFLSNDGINSKSYVSKFTKTKDDWTISRKLESTTAFIAVATLIGAVALSVISAPALILGMIFAGYTMYQGLESAEKDRTGLIFGRGSGHKLYSSNWFNLALLKGVILDSSGVNGSLTNSERLGISILNQIYTQIEYDKDLNFNLQTLYSKMNNGEEIWDFTTDIVKQYLIENPIILKYSKLSKYFKESNQGLTFSLSNIIDQNFFENEEKKEKSGLINNGFTESSFAQDWLKYILGFPYQEGLPYFKENHTIQIDNVKKNESLDSNNIQFEYFSGILDEVNEIFEETDALIPKISMEEKKEELNKNKSEFEEKIKSLEESKTEINLRIKKAKDDFSKNKTVTALDGLKRSTFEDNLKLLNEELNKNLEDSKPIIEKLKEINNNIKKLDTSLYLKDIFEQGKELYKNTNINILYPSGETTVSNLANVDWTSLYSFFSTIPLPDKSDERNDVLKNFKQKLTLTDNFISIFLGERKYVQRPNHVKEPGKYFFFSQSQNVIVEDFLQSFALYSNKTEEKYVLDESKLQNIFYFEDEINKLYNNNEFFTPNYQYKRSNKDLKYENLKDLFFNIPSGLKQGICTAYKEHNDKTLGFLKNLLEEIIKELLSSEFFKKNLNISENENVSDSFDFGKDKNNYPDIDLPIDPSEVNSNVNLNPGFFYYESDFNDKILTDVDNRANNILRKSLKFMNDLESGFVTGDGKNLQKGDPADNYVKDIIIDTQDSSSSSYLVKGGSGDNFKDLVLNPNASVKINFQQDSMTALTANDIAFIDIKNLVESSQSEVRLQTLTDKIKEIQDKTSSIDIAFGSRTGFLNEPLSLLNFYKTYNQKGDSLFFENSNTEKAIAGKLGIFDDADLSNNKEDISMVMKQSGRKLFQKQFKMQKAYPTFRLFLIEEDAIESDTYFVFDDFYSFSAVKDFTVYKSKKLAADTAIIRLQNVSGVLDGTKLGVIRDVDYEMATNRIKEVEAEKKAEEKNTQVIESLVLRPGVACQLRAGYSSNPKELTILLSGKIADVSWSSSGDMCEVVVQSFGVELEVRKYGSSDVDSGVSELEFHTTHKLLGWCMFRNELKHFGRFKKERLFQTGISNSESKEVVISKESYIGTPPGYSDSMFQFFQSNWGWFVVADVLLSVATVFIGGARGLAKEAVSEATEAVAKTAAKEAGEEVVEAAAKEAAEATVIEATKAAAKTTAKATFISKTAQYLASAMNISDNLLTGTKWYSKGLLAPFRWAFGSGWNPGANTVIVNNVLRRIATDTAGLSDDALEAAVKATLLENAKGGRGPLLTTLGKIFGLNVAVAGSNLKRLLTVSPKAVLSGIQKATKEGVLDQKVANALVKEMSTSFNVLYAGRSALESFSLGFVKASKFSILALGIGASIDIVSNIVSASTGYLSDLISNTLNPYSEKIALSPQDDAIYAPHPDRYIKPKNETIGVRFADIMKKTGIAFLNAMSMYQAEANAEKLQKDIILGRTLAMDKRMYSSSGENIFKLKNHTIWEVFHEMSLRHPGWVYGARHYGTGLEYRMFFGLPNQRYFGAPLNNRTIYRMNDIIRAISNNDLASMRKLVGETANTIDNYLKDTEGLKANFDTAKSAMYKSILLNEWNRVTEKRFTPFRNYHLVSSKFNLVANNIKGVNNDVINEIAVLFVNNSSTENPEYTQRIIRSHENIPEDQIHAKAVKYDNCKGFNSALRYGTSELLNAAKEMYAGEILILGNPEINPYDVILLDDQYSEMYGPIEVEAVTHIFSMDTGFITEIKPNALVTANEGLTYPIINSVIMYDVGRELAEKSPFDFVNTVKTYRKNPNDEKSKNTIKTRLNELVNKWFDKEVGTFELFGLFPNTVQIGFSDYLKMDDNQQAKIKESIVEDLLKQVQTNNIVLQAEILNPNASIDSLIDTSAITGLLSSAAAIALATTVKFGTTKLPIAFFTALAAASGNFNSVINNQLRTPDSLLANKLIPGDMLVSQVADGNLMQIFPLYKNNKPLIYAGYDKINAKRRIKNKFGNIFTDFSDAMETFNIMLKEYANKENIIYSEPNFVAETAGILSDAAQSLLPFKLPEGTIRGYINSYTPDQLINKSLK